MAVNAPRSRPSTWAALGAAALLALLSLAVYSTRDDQATTDVVLLGDSIAQEAFPYLQPLSNITVLERYFGGTAPCDWLDKDLLAARRRVVVVSFTGNSLTPCMADGAGGFLRGQALVDKYRVDLTALVGRIRSTYARVVLVGQPQRGPGAGDAINGNLEVAGINTIYGELAESGSVSFVDAGAAVEASDGAFAAVLPCLPREPECGAAGNNPVRSDDGVHLCPGLTEGPCPTYSSGAFRFATAIAEAINAL